MVNADRYAVSVFILEILSAFFMKVAVLGNKGTAKDTGNKASVLVEKTDNE